MQQTRIFFHPSQTERDNFASPDMKSNDKLPRMNHCNEIDSPDPCSIYHPSNLKIKPVYKSIVAAVRADLSSMKENQPPPTNNSNRGGRSSSRLAASIQLASELDISFENKVIDSDDILCPSSGRQLANLSSPVKPAGIPSSSFRKNLYSPTDRDVTSLLDAMTDVSTVSPMKPSASMYPMPTLEAISTGASMEERTQQIAEKIQPKPPPNKPQEINHARRRAVVLR